LTRYIYKIQVGGNGLNLSKTSIKVILATSGVLLVTKLLTAAGLISGLAGTLFGNAGEAGAVGIIGGADGPTAIYVAGKVSWMPALLPGLLTLAEIALLGFLFVKAIKAVRK
jgi:Na+-transporting methylmalonyl-CoA/oxaloacetate decarboxylase beta subunit